MLNLRINGGTVQYDTLEDARKASRGELPFWRETLELCAKDEKYWNDFTNELWQSGGAEEAVKLYALFKESDMRRWPLMAFVLSDCNNCELWKSISSAFAGKADALVAWLQGPAARALSGAPDLVLDGPLKTAILDAIDGKEAQFQAWLREYKEKWRAVPPWVAAELSYWQMKLGKAKADAEAERRRKEQQVLYRVIDLETWSVTTLDHVPDGGWTDEYKTTKLVLRRIEPGTFTMGSSEGEQGRDSNEKQHRVTLTKPYYIGVFEVTQRQWSLVVGGTPSRFSGDKRPVEGISYNSIRGDSKGSRWPMSSDVDADSFLGKLRTKTGSTEFDLPTEAQWEYACRAGANGSYAEELCTMGWYDGNSRGQTHDVGLKQSNAWGLYDMHGNVWEWCLDWKQDYSGDVTDPKGPESGDRRISRGGSWLSNASDCRSAYRFRYSPGDTDNRLGFRLSCSAEPAV